MVISESIKLHASAGHVSKLLKKIIHTVSMQTPEARLVVVLTISVLLYLIKYEQLLKIPALSLYSIAKIPSPSIGLTRAYWFLIHGRWAEAYYMNKLVYLVALVLIAIIIKDIYIFIRGTNKKTK